MEALPLAPEKLKDERKSPPLKLKKVNLLGDERATFIAEGLTENFERNLILK